MQEENQKNEAVEPQQAPPQQPIPQPQPIQKKSKKKFMVLAVGVTLTVIVSIPLLLFAYILGIFSWSNFKLDSEASTNKKALDSILIVSGINTDSEASPNGDALTGNSSPAKAKFTVNEPLLEIRQEVEENIKKQGFILKDDLKSNPIPSVADTFEVIQPTFNTTVEGVAVLAVNGENALMIRYWFDEKIECDIDPGVSISEPCYFARPVTLPTSGLDNLMVREVEVFYDDLKSLSYPH